MQPFNPAGARWCSQHSRYECVYPRKRNRGLCHGPAVTGNDHCRMHLGEKAAPVIAEAKLKEQAAKELARLDVPPVADPLTELARLAGQAVAWKDAMAGRVNELTSIRYSTEGGEQLRSELLLWERALDRCVMTLTAMARLNIEERLAGIRKQTADMLERAFDAGMEASGASFEGKAKGREAFKRHLKVVADGRTEPASG